MPSKHETSEQARDVIDSHAQQARKRARLWKKHGSLRTSATHAASRQQAAGSSARLFRVEAPRRRAAQQLLVIAQQRLRDDVGGPQLLHRRQRLAAEHLLQAVRRAAYGAACVSTARGGRDSRQRRAGRQPHGLAGASATAERPGRAGSTTSVPRRTCIMQPRPQLSTAQGGPCCTAAQSDLATSAGRYCGATIQLACLSAKSPAARDGCAACEHVAQAACVHCLHQLPAPCKPPRDSCSSAARPRSRL